MASFIVIGANWGDEGKGLLTDYLVRANDAVDVTRFNGGSQAGHTVVEAGRRNVYNGLSSGTTAGAVTRLAKQFIVNPLALDRERLALEINGYSPKKLLIHPECIVTTPFEVWLNQEAELARGRDRHGSCGLGIGETVERSELLGLSVGDLWGIVDDVVRTLRYIGRWYVPRRAAELGIEAKLTHSQIESSIEFFMQDVVGMLNDCMANDDNMLADFFKPTAQAIVYEGAQGLALDQELGVFPHVTRSNTGLLNALLDLQSRNRPPETIQAVYVTRSYLTRHGAGPFMNSMNSGDVLCGGTVQDETNIPNPWQGTLRFAPLHIPELGRRIKMDLGRALADPRILPSTIARVDPQIALTCLDQGSSVLAIERDGQSPKELKMSELGGRIEAITGIAVAYQAFGPEAKNIEALS